MLVSEIGKNDSMTVVLILPVAKGLITCDFSNCQIELVIEYIYLNIFISVKMRVCYRKGFKSLRIVLYKTVIKLSWLHVKNTPFNTDFRSFFYVDA